MPRAGAIDDEPPAKKRKRDPLDESDPKLSEYLEVFGGHSSKKLRDGEVDDKQGEAVGVVMPPELEAGESDDEYEQIPSRHQVSQGQQSQNAADQKTAITAEAILSPHVPESSDDVVKKASQVPEGATDDDWLRSRTNRLLDLIDPEDSVSPVQAPPQPPASHQPGAEQVTEGSPEDAAGVPEVGSRKNPETALSLVEKTRRLFLRNLSYAATEDNIRDYFSTFGNLEEVRTPLLTYSFPTLCMMNPR